MNVYGPRQDYRGAYIAVIMKMLDAIDKGEGPTILGDGSEASISSRWKIAREPISAPWARVRRTASTMSAPDSGPR